VAVHFPARGPTGRVAVTFHLDAREGLADLAKVVALPANRGGSNVLQHPMYRGGARNRHDPRLLRQQPDERDLSAFAVVVEVLRYRRPRTETSPFGLRPQAQLISPIAIVSIGPSYCCSSQKSSICWVSVRDPKYVVTRECRRPE